MEAAPPLAQQAKRRPAPLSDEVISFSGGVGGYPAGPVLLGATNNGVPLPVKNTFVDIPSGHTPVSMKHGWFEPQLSAPASLSKFRALMQRNAATSATHEADNGEAMLPGQPQPSAVPVATPNAESLFAATPRSAFDSTPPLSPPQPKQGPSEQRAPVWAPSTQEPGNAAAAAGYASRLSRPTGYGLTLRHSKAAAPFAGSAMQATTRAAPEVASPARRSDQHGAATSPVPEHLEADPEAEADGGEDSDSGSDDAPLANSILTAVADAPKPPPGALHPSIGSEPHALGMCKRCCFFSRGRCLNGYECEFCHYEHDKRKRKNKKKRTKTGLTKVAVSSAASKAARAAAAAFAARQDHSGAATYLAHHYHRDLADSAASAGPLVLATPGPCLATYQQTAGAAAAAAAPASMLVRGCCEAMPGQQYIVYHAPQAMGMPCPQPSPAEVLMQRGLQQPLSTPAPAQQQQAAALANPAPPPEMPPRLQQVVDFTAPPPPPMQSPKLRRLFGTMML